MSARASPLDPASSTPAATPASPQDPGGEPGGLLRSEEPGPLQPGSSGGLGEGESAEPTGFVGATLAELSKVVWPSRQQLFSETVAVILMVGVSAAAIAAIDRFYRWLSLVVFR